MEPLCQKIYQEVYDLGSTEAVTRALPELAEKYSATPTGIAAAWILCHPADMQLISGSVSEQRIKEICRGADITLTREDWYALYLAAGYCLP